MEIVDLALTSIALGLHFTVSCLRKWTEGKLYELKFQSKPSTWGEDTVQILQQ